MRENMGLYRGKRKDTGEWVYGDLIHDKGEQKERLFIWYETDTFPFVNEAEVDPETVGQYTGLTDKNGTRIFEGDILSGHLDDLFPEEESRYEVVWHDYGWHIKSGSGFFDAMEQNWINMFLEVIGNIHDNPELLEGLTMQAIWYVDYDSRTDKLYTRPCCPECREPIGKLPGGGYRCYSCGEIVQVKSKKMKDWFKAREETKTELDDCHVLTHPDGLTIGCDCKNCVEIHYRRNNATLEWQAVSGECKKCGLRWFV